MQQRLLVLGSDEVGAGCPLLGRSVRNWAALLLDHPVGHGVAPEFAPRAETLLADRAIPLRIVGTDAVTAQHKRARKEKMLRGWLPQHRLCNGSELERGKCAVDGARDVVLEMLNVASQLVHRAL